MQSFSEFFSVFLLCFAVCIDTFAAAFGFGADGVFIPLRSAFSLSFFSALTLCLSMGFSGLLSPFLPDGAARWISFFVLCGLGFLKLFESAVKKAFSRAMQAGKPLRFSFLQFRLLLQIYIDPAKADADASHSLSGTEAAALAVALSSDGIAAGLGSGLQVFSPLLVFLFGFLFQFCGILLGFWAGKKTSRLLGRDFSFLGGAVLIVMGFLSLRQ